VCQTSLCTINVSGPANKPVVDPYTLVVPPNTPVTIVWHLTENGAVFRSNDGPRFEHFDPHSDDEFDRIGPSDAAGNAVNPPSAFYAVKYKNTQTQKKHKHSVKFKGQNGNDAECDPTINNTTN